METETFLFVTCRDTGFATEHFYGTQHYAVKKFAALTNDPKVLGCYFYAASTGGLVNAYHQPGACK